MDICVVIDKDAADALIKYCGRPLLHTAPGNIPNLPFLLKKMFQSGLITTSGQSMLAAALKVVRADNCIDCIHKYRNKYEYTELKVTDALVNDLRGENSF